MKPTPAQDKKPASRSMLDQALLVGLGLSDASAKIVAEEIERLRREIDALKHGEFICQKCSIRKDGEHDSSLPEF